MAEKKAREVEELYVNRGDRILDLEEAPLRREGVHSPIVLAPEGECGKISEAKGNRVRYMACARGRGTGGRLLLATDRDRPKGEDKKLVTIRPRVIEATG